jgi:hypothetical protein
MSANIVNTSAIVVAKIFGTCTSRLGNVPTTVGLADVDNLTTFMASSLIFHAVLIS